MKTIQIRPRKHLNYHIKNNPGKAKEASKLSYKNNPGKAKEAFKLSYKNNPGKAKEASKLSYKTNPNKAKEASKLSYKNNSIKAKEASKLSYKNNPEKAKEASKAAYMKDPEKAKDYSKLAYKKDPGKSKAASKMRYLRKKKQIRKERRDRYSLRIPNDILLKKYIKGVASKFLSNPEVKLRLTMQFYKQYKAYAVTLNRRQKAKVTCKIAAKKFVYTILSVRKFNAGLLIKHVRNVNSQSILSREDFGNACHTVSSEPFFYDTSYRHLADSSILKIDKKHKKLAFIKPNLNPEEYFFSGPIPVDENGKAHLFVSNIGDKVKCWSCSAK